MLRFMALGATMVGGCALIQHQLPGMEGWLFWDQVRVSSASKPYTMYFPLDKVLMGLILAVCSGRLMMERHQTPFVEWGTVFRVGGLCIVSLMGVSLASGHVIFDPKWTILAGVWAVNNLLFQCFAEEMLYRGLIQQTLVDYAKRLRVSSFWPVLLSALIFGLSHYRGGLPFMVLSAVAGGFYGYVYLKTHRLDVAIGLHFALNFIHFVLFTYPAALRL